MIKETFTMGVDISTQSITALLLNIATAEVELEQSVRFTEQSLNRHGIDPATFLIPNNREGCAEQPPELFLEAFEVLLQRIRASGFDLSRITAINISAQQHGHLYLNRQGLKTIDALNTVEEAETPLHRLFDACFAYPSAPIWISTDSETAAEEIRRQAGGTEKVTHITGSDIPARFTGAVIRKVAKESETAYLNSEKIHLISSFFTAILSGKSNAPVDYGNSCGTALMNYRHLNWSETMLSATAAGLPGGTDHLRKKLPQIAAPQAPYSLISRYFVLRFGFSPDCMIHTGSGDNPQTKVLAAGDLLSLGTSLVYMKNGESNSLSNSPAAVAMIDGLSRPFTFYCRTNGALVWDRTRKEAGAENFEMADRLLENQTPGTLSAIWQPERETAPISNETAPVSTEKFTKEEFYPAIIDSSLYLLHSACELSTQYRDEPLFLTGGPAASLQIRRRIASIWNRPVRLLQRSGAALGAAAAAMSVQLKGRESDRVIAQKIEQAAGAGEAIYPDKQAHDRYHGDYGQRTMKLLRDSV